MTLPRKPGYSARPNSQWLPNTKEAIKSAESGVVHLRVKWPKRIPRNTVMGEQLGFGIQNINKHCPKKYIDEVVQEQQNTKIEKRLLSVARAKSVGTEELSIKFKQRIQELQEQETQFERRIGKCIEPLKGVISTGNLQTSFEHNLHHRFHSLRIRLNHKFHEELDLLKTGNTNKRKRSCFSAKATEVLKKYVNKNIYSPYPTDIEKRELAARAQITFDQVSNWFTNFRSRKWEHRNDSSKAAKIKKKESTFDGNNEAFNGHTVSIPPEEQNPTFQNNSNTNTSYGDSLQNFITNENQLPMVSFPSNQPFQLPLPQFQLPEPPNFPNIDENPISNNNNNDISDSYPSEAKIQNQSSGGSNYSQNYHLFAGHGEDNLFPQLPLPEIPNAMNSCLTQQYNYDESSLPPIDFENSTILPNSGSANITGDENIIQTYGSDTDIPYPSTTLTFPFPENTIAYSNYKAVETTPSTILYDLNNMQNPIFPTTTSLTTPSSTTTSSSSTTAMFASQINYTPQMMSLMSTKTTNTMATAVTATVLSSATGSINNNNNNCMVGSNIETVLDTNNNKNRFDKSKETNCQEKPLNNTIKNVTTTEPKRTPILKKAPILKKTPLKPRRKRKRDLPKQTSTLLNAEKEKSIAKSPPPLKRKKRVQTPISQDPLIPIPAFLPLKKLNKLSSSPPPCSSLSKVAHTACGINIPVNRVKAEGSCQTLENLYSPPRIRLVATNGKPIIHKQKQRKKRVQRTRKRKLR
eukprot:TRINITY_DN377682_c0_g2_i1.p1 TRINITY_DN377682_c0_g2~~TRINITY_DN377682_c0_g2_i1.p1  ORF type:complete len:749 (+),score=205.81 TRINITY_DN377682_c0_g2_i1:63-2309(+)